MRSTSITIEQLELLVKLAKEKGIKIDFSNEEEPYSQTMGMKYSATLYKNQTLEQWYNELSIVFRNMNITMFEKEFQNLEHIYNTTDTENV